MMDQTVFERHESKVRSYCRSFPALFERASGHHLWDTEGRRYVDLLCGAGSLNYGHNPARIVERVTEYLTGGGPVQSLDLHTTAKAEFLRRFSEEVLAPKGFGDYVMQFPGPAGTLAVEAALKLARKVTGRANVIAFRGGFHGASLGSLAATTSPLLRRAAGTILPSVTLVDYDNGPGHPDTAAELLHMLRPTSRVAPPAAILLETVQGEGGLNVASRAWLAGIRRVADAVGALVIVDDIQAGCGRTGSFFSFEHVPELRPDLVCLSKSLSGMGLPMAMLLVRRDRDQWEPGEHNGTFRGQNLAFVAGTAALDYWADPAFVAHVPELGVAIRESLRDLVARLPEGMATTAGRGTMSGLRFADARLAEQVRAALFRASIIAETSGDGRVLKLLPPLTMSLSEWAETAERISDTVVGTAMIGVAA
ncbi:diaminobutyrate--2-oxoglutarate transaminase [Amycolatopsis keratiniphila]|uniref:Diaminobutyrate--2-oxoglutarate transaminase n=1 Tax=Amycolatopsis keratiniphila subsp. keratiniphila TaxID=227715 RepID=A0A1W2LXH9_9PSEU|nr:diaminobutyrate--2-oxoglutarate transaminase [Amycolatopsis keratiniphila]OLZ48650.1 diaminobutyrate--2-oxoglutarate transaminase [Amycolatopsis keratiniphila subsp. nogabecina]ONF71606.1 diaminobutyrate--2-oxoglutarate transaminase [Amycolatopsis keratiniphila subsp. keratiniphila]SDU35755.1 diaminobutyrate-2-oxoglutarate transaminase [Amycolatopsis keratiniphila]